MLLNKKNLSILLVNQLKNCIVKSFYVVLSPVHFCKKVSFNSISRAGEREIKLSVGEQVREDGLIKSCPPIRF